MKLRDEDFKENTVTIVVRYGGQTFAKGYTITGLGTDAEIAQAISSVYYLQQAAIQTIFYELAKTCLAGMPELTPRQQEYITNRSEALNQSTKGGE